MIVGDEQDAKISNTIFKVQNHLNRDINFIIWSSNDFKEKLATKNSFLINITSQKIVWIMGDQNEFGRIVKERLGKKNRAR
jgi:hypothetical protein